MTSTSESFLKSKDIDDHCKVNFVSVSYSFSVIQVAAVCTEQAMLIYIYLRVSVYWSLCPVCLTVFALKSEY